MGVSLVAVEHNKEVQLEAELEAKGGAVYKAFHDRYVWCVCCGKPEISAHHIVYRSRDGLTTLANLIPLCPSSCHKRAHGEVVDGLGPIVLHHASMTVTITDLEGEVLAEGFTFKAHEPTQEDGQEAFDRHIKILNLAHLFQSTGVELGIELRGMYESKGFKALGYDTFPMYVAAELPVGKSTAYEILNIELNRKQLGIEPTEITGIARNRLRFVLDTATVDTATEMLEFAKTHPLSEIKAEYDQEYIEPEIKYGQIHSHPCHYCGKMNEYKGEA